jgi:hypothetical protein
LNKYILSDDFKKRKIFCKIFRTGKFSMENFPPHITKKDPTKHSCVTNLKSLMNREHEHLDACDKTLFYTIYKISLSRNCRCSGANLKIVTYCCNN